MGSYYYLMAGLPELKADGSMPITYSEFLTSCDSIVSDEDLEILKDLTLSSTKGPFLKEWGGFYRMLTGELSYQRSLNLGRSYPSSYEKDGSVAQVVSSALSAKNPLEAERILLDYEFEYLDLLVGPNMFDDYALFGYAVKLRLLERLSCFEKEKGKAEFDSLFDGIQQRVYSL